MIYLSGYINSKTASCLTIQLTQNGTSMHFGALLWTIKDRKRYLNFQHDTVLEHTGESSVQLLQTIFDESMDSWVLCLPLYHSLNMGNFYLQLQLPGKKFTKTYIFRMLHKLRSEMLFLKCSLKLVHTCKMPIGLAATVAWGGQSGFYYDMHACVETPIWLRSSGQYPNSSAAKLRPASHWMQEQ